MNLSTFLHNFFCLNWTATIGINHAIGGVKMVLRMPVKVYGKLRWSIDGEIILPKDAHRGMLMIGSSHEDYTASSGKAQMDIKGKWIVGGDVRIGPDCFIGVFHGASLTIGDGTFIGRDSQIHCSGTVNIGKDVFCGETYICDSTEHQLIQDGKEKERHGSVTIGDGTYMGFRTMILKGSVIPPRSVVGSGAVSIKDFSMEKEKVFIAGVPAEVRRKDCTAVK